MGRHLRRFVALLCVLVLSLPSCSVNVLEAFGDLAANDALYEDAKTLINQGSYEAALNKFSLMSADYLTRRNVRILQASAYAGVCGVDFLNLLNALNAIGATRIMVWMLQNFPGGTAQKQAACIQAESLIKAIGTYGQDRTADENLLMAFVSFAKIGAILTRYADTAPADGSVDGGFDPCSIGSLPATEAKEINTGFNIAIDALSHIGSLTIGSGSLTGLTSACGLVPPGTLNLCASPAEVNISDVDATEEKGMRSLIKENSSVGLGTCVGDITVCNCP